MGLFKMIVKAYKLKDIPVQSNFFVTYAYILFTDIHLKTKKSFENLPFQNF